MTEGNSNKEGYCTFDYTMRVMNSHAGSNSAECMRKLMANNHFKIKPS